jgi:hypothetical protein
VNYSQLQLKKPMQQADSKQRMRSVNPSDQPILAKWIANDPAHAGVLTPEFFMSDQAQCLVYEAFDGLNHHPALYIRLEPVTPVLIRAFVQFPDDRRNGRHLMGAFQIVKDTLAKAGFTHLVFDSVSPTLIRFCTRRLGFVYAGEQDYIATL